jgi:hypothetical protein
MKKTNTATNAEDFDMGFDIQLKYSKPDKGLPPTAYQDVESAKAAFIEHWPRALTALRVILDGTETGSASVAKALHWLFDDCLRPAMRTNRHGGNFVFEAAQSMTRELVALAQAQPPPLWLVERAPKEHAVPWLMVNGKPAPGFDESDAALAWGQETTRRGKSQFDKRKTRVVADALHDIYKVWNMSRSRGRDLPCRPEHLEALCDFTHGNSDIAGAVFELPPLSAKSRKQWWDVVRAVIRRKTELPKPGARRIIFKKDTPAERLKAYLKDCEAAFDALCPADAPGDKCPDSSPRPVVCQSVPVGFELSQMQEAIAPLAKLKGARDNEGARTRSTEKPTAGRGSNTRRSPRNHRSRHGGERRPR